MHVPWSLCVRTRETLNISILHPTQIHSHLVTEVPAVILLGLFISSLLSMGQMELQKFVSIDASQQYIL